MSLDKERNEAQPLTRVDQLLAYFQEGEKPRPQQRVGLEHEKLLFPKGQATPVAYEGTQGVHALLSALAKVGYEPFVDPETQRLIALTRGALTVSLEPGGQFELSGSPQPTARDAHQENLRHLADVKKAADEVGLFPAALGYRPFGDLAQMPWMPKARYQAMRQSLGARGALALDMMLMTATGQVSLDWADEADCARKLTVATRVSPIMVALYANSAIVRGKPSGFMSFRSHVWTQVDPARCGVFPAMLDGSFSYRAYVEWALDAPLLFLRRDGRYLVPQITFRQLMKDGFEGKPAQEADWVDHLSTLFPEVRIKKVLEVRGADCVSAELTGALVALWRGLLYEPGAMADAEQLLPRLTLADHQSLSNIAARHGLRGKFRSQTLAQLARELVAISRRGLARLDPADVPLLAPLEELAQSGASLAERALAQLQAGKSPAEIVAAAAL